MRMPWYRRFGRAFRAGTFLVAHALLALLLIGAIAVVKRAVIWDGDPKMFDFLPIRYIFDGVDLLLLATFMVFGTNEAIEVLRENDDE